MTQAVLSPVGFPPKVKARGLVQSLDSLAGRKLYLVDCLFDNSDNFMDQLQDWFGQHLPAVNTKIIRPRESWVDDPEMRGKVADDGDAAILGVGL